MLKSTGNRQEPFVYGALGGGNIALVPPPVVRQETPVSDVKADYELVQKIGTRRAWEVFLGTHPTGFYADLARAQIEALNAAAGTAVEHRRCAYPPAGVPEPRDTDQGGAGMGQGQGLRPTWRHCSASSSAFRTSPLSINAQQRIDLLKKAAQEREEQARAEREATRKAAEEALRQAEQRRAEEAAAKRREEDQRRAREAEAAEKAKAAAAEAAAAKQREEDARRAQATEARAESQGRRSRAQGG